MLKQVLTSKPAITIAIFIALLVPLGFIEDLVRERAQYHADAVADIADSWTSGQQVLGPLVVVRYEVEVDSERWDKNLEAYVTASSVLSRTALLPMKTLDMEAIVDVEVRSRGIHDVPVYRTTADFVAAWQPSVLPAEIRDGTARVTAAYLWVWSTDQRGFTDLPDATWEGESLAWQAGGHPSLSERGVRADIPLEELRVAAVVSGRIGFRGTGTLSVVPAGETSHVTIAADWPHPKFVGRFLPDERSVSDTGFTARWSVTTLATNVGRLLEHCAAGECAALTGTYFGVELIEPVDEYAQALRAVKYAFLFVLLVFTGMLLVEILRELDIHPVQYAMTGAAMAVFYLLLIAFSEHVPFAMAYVGASLMSVGLLGYYGRYVLGSRRDGITFATTIAALYAILFVILQAEDTALLMGSLLTFLVLTALIVVTRDPARLRSLRLHGGDRHDRGDGAGDNAVPQRPA